MLAGLMGLPQKNLVNDETDEDFTKFRHLAHHTGSIIRESAGLEEVSA